MVKRLLPAGALQRNKDGKGHRESQGWGLSILNREVREGFMEKVTLKPRPEQVKEQGYVGIKCLQAEHQAAVGTLSAKTLWQGMSGA